MAKHFLQYPESLNQLVDIQCTSAAYNSSYHKMEL